MGDYALSGIGTESPELYVITGKLDFTRGLVL
jgi:hypothetical protein